ncbi:DUF3099 domain-containing protein [Corynebacterium mastitidis]
MASHGDGSQARAGAHAEVYEASETIGASVPSPARPARARSLRRGGRRGVALITDARRTPEQDRRHRERVYGALQAARLPMITVALTTLVAWENWWIAGTLFCVSIPMPWIAVVLANTRGEPRDARAQQVYKPALMRQQAAAAQSLETATYQALTEPEPPKDR